MWPLSRYLIDPPHKPCAITCGINFIGLLVHVGSSTEIGLTRDRKSLCLKGQERCTIQVPLRWAGILAVEGMSRKCRSEIRLSGLTIVRRWGEGSGCQAASSVLRGQESELRKVVLARFLEVRSFANRGG
jgi:hypothetical protein